MKKVGTYLIKWYGPFKSRKDVKDEEEKRLETFNLYLFQAKCRGKKDRYYCGQTFSQKVWKRLGNHNHHIHDFEDKNYSLQIWIGTISNVKATNRIVDVCENIIISLLAYIGVGEKYLENRTNKKPPLNDVYIFNEWLRSDDSYIMKRTRNSLPAIIPEAMVYYRETNNLFGANNLKYKGPLGSE